MEKYSAEEQRIISQFRSMNKDLKNNFKEIACAFSMASRKGDNTTSQDEIIQFSPAKT